MCGASIMHASCGVLTTPLVPDWYFVDIRRIPNGEVTLAVFRTNKLTSFELKSLRGFFVITTTAVDKVPRTFGIPLSICSR